VAEADNANGGGGGAVAVKVWLSNRPSGDVFVAVRAAAQQVNLNATSTNFDKADDDAPFRTYVDDDGAGFTLLGPFTAANWERSQSFTVSAYDDDSAEWSAADSTDVTPLSLRFDGQNGDDVLALYGVSKADDRCVAFVCVGNLRVRGASHTNTVLKHPKP
jgi:hypothetical protein